MTNKPAWLSKIVDADRTGFVNEHGSKLVPKLAPEPSPPPALAKIVDDERLGLGKSRARNSL